MAKIGIICNSFKQSKFEEVLLQEGFNNYEVSETKSKELKLIKVETEMKNQNKINAICNFVEAYFQSLKN